MLREWTSIPERIDREELLDLGHGSLDEVRRSLADVTRINRWLGGSAALRRFVFPRLARCSQRGPLRLLDVGAGSATVPLAIARWAARQGRQVRITALDNNERHLAIAAEAVAGCPEIELLRGDARHLPFAPGSFDVVVSTLLLHHFDPTTLRDMLPRLAAVCRGVVILNDLVRNRVPALFFRLASPLIARSPLTRYDGYVSVQRAYTPQEMGEIAESAGLSSARIYTQGLYYRMTVVIERHAE